jgi:hypothetical protein
LEFFVNKFYVPVMLDHGKDVIGVGITPDANFAVVINPS